MFQYRALWKLAFYNLSAFRIHVAAEAPLFVGHTYIMLRSENEIGLIWRRLFRMKLFSQSKSALHPGKNRFRCKMEKFSYLALQGSKFSGVHGRNWLEITWLPAPLRRILISYPVIVHLGFAACYRQLELGSCPAE